MFQTNNFLKLSFITVATIFISIFDFFFSFVFKINLGQNNHICFWDWSGVGGHASPWSPQ